MSKFIVHILCAIVCFLLTISARNLQSSLVLRNTNIGNPSEETLHENPLLMKDSYGNEPRYMKDTDQDKQQCLFHEELKAKPKSVAPRSRTDREIFSIWALKNSLRSKKNKILQDMHHREGVSSSTNKKPTALEKKKPSERKRFAKFPTIQKKKDYDYDDDLERSAYNDIEDMKVSDKDQDYDSESDSESDSDSDVDRDYGRHAENTWFTGYKDNIDKKIENSCKDKSQGRPRERENDHEKDRSNEPCEEKNVSNDKSREKVLEKNGCNEPCEEKDQVKSRPKDDDQQKEWCKDTYEEIDKIEDKSRGRDMDRDWCKDLEKDNDIPKNKCGNDSDKDKEKAIGNCETHRKNMDRNKGCDRNRDGERSKIKEKHKYKDRCGEKGRDRGSDHCFGREQIKMTRLRNRGNHRIVNFNDLLNSRNAKNNNLTKKNLKKRKTSWQNIFRKGNKKKFGKNKSLIDSTEVIDSFDKTLRLIENYKQLATTIVEYTNDIEAALVKYNDIGCEEGIDREKHLALTCSPDGTHHLNV